MSSKIRYAVVGSGYIAQAAMLPAFSHAKNSELVAIVSDDPDKRRKLGKMYGVKATYGYDQYDECLMSGIDAVYIALPNSMHCDFSVRALDRAIHVLCEKPMAMTSHECEKMIRAASRSKAKLMIAYRLHFEAANLNAIELVTSGKLGEPRIFTSTFTMQIEAGNIRLERELGGGCLYDIGVYCINAARSLFRSEPTEVTAVCATGHDPRFSEVGEMFSAVMRFPNDRIASFTCSFGAAETGDYRVIGTRGDLLVKPAYDPASGLGYELTVDGRTKTRFFPKRDQFAPELVHFSECIRSGVDPEPSGHEGYADVRVIEALLKSAKLRRPVELDAFVKKNHPDLSLEMHRPPVRRPKLVHVSPPIQR